ncbi:S1 family peptidase [Halorhodospira neutriphila]|uniref:Serine protease n=1 Tax=Halorhodospira neutriphila TaxID=168379 RepID=A0ABS1E6R8_9GAMM|nr:serine protease [Halorhodospira neutriphila]MBK1726817.1 serine protease [Halorhodospira neutriphila]
MIRRWHRLASAGLALSLCLLAGAALARSGEALPETIERVRPSVVGVGTHQPTANPQVDFHGTGFAVEDGRAVITNNHVLPAAIDGERRERLVVLAGDPGEPDLREARIVMRSESSDLAVLRISGPPLPALQPGEPGRLRPGNRVAFTGFPIGMILGFHPVTHTAMISARTPLTLPARRSSELDSRHIARLRRGDPPMVFQLDGTAYPGNSGSPVYDPQTGEVYAVLNQVYVQGGREAAIQEPSGISYAVPFDLAEPLLERYRQRHR